MKIYVFILRRAQLKKLEAPMETIEATACQKYTRTCCSPDFLLNL